MSRIAAHGIGEAYRVPTCTGSIAELNLCTERKVTAEQVNDAFRKAAAYPPLRGILGVLEEEWASSGIWGESRSSIVDLPLTAVQGDLLSVAAWYDNEWGMRRARPRPRPRSHPRSQPRP